VLSDSYEQDVDTYQVKEREQPTFTGLAKGDPGVKPVKQGKTITMKNGPVEASMIQM
jgi:hypothetical protein